MKIRAEEIQTGQTIRIVDHAIPGDDFNAANRVFWYLVEDVAADDFSVDVIYGDERGWTDTACFDVGEMVEVA
mgnify:CR=1 FL=1